MLKKVKYFAVPFFAMILLATCNPVLALAPSSSIHGGDANTVFEEITDSYLIPSAFDFAETATGRPGEMRSLREMWQKDPARFMKETKTIVAKDPATGTWLAMMTMTLDFPKNVMDQVVYGQTAYPEPLGCINAIVVDPNAKRPELEPKMLALAEVLLTGANQATVVVFSRNEDRIRLLNFHGYDRYADQAIAFTKNLSAEALTKAQYLFQVYTSIVNRFAQFHGPDTEVWKLYLLIYLTREENPELRRTVFGYFKKQNVIDEREMQAIQEKVQAPVGEALRALAALRPNTRLAGVQNMYAFWLKDILGESYFGGGTYRELERALDGGAVAVDVAGRTLPLSVFLLINDYDRQRVFDDITAATNALSVESYTSAAANKAAEKDLRIAIAQARKGQPAYLHYTHYLDYVIGLEAPKILAHVDHPSKGAVVLELGGATGALMRKWMEKFPDPSGRHMVVEDDAAWVEAGKQLALEKGLPTLDLCQGDARNLAFLKKESVSVVLMQQLMNEFHAAGEDEKIFATIAEIDRVLKVGGQIHVVDDSNTPLLTYRLLEWLGYDLVQRQSIPTAKGYNDYLLLSFQKTRSYTPENIAHLKAFPPENWPRCVRPASPYPGMLELERETVRKDRAKIPAVESCYTYEINYEIGKESSILRNHIAGKQARNVNISSHEFVIGRMREGSKFQWNLEWDDPAYDCTILAIKAGDLYALVHTGKPDFPIDQVLEEMQRVYSVRPNVDRIVVSYNNMYRSEAINLSRKLAERFGKEKIIVKVHRYTAENSPFIQAAIGPIGVSFWSGFGVDTKVNVTWNGSKWTDIGTGGVEDTDIKYRDSAVEASL